MVIITDYFLFDKSSVNGSLEILKWKVAIFRKSLESQRVSSLWPANYVKQSGLQMCHAGKTLMTSQVDVCVNYVLIDKI